MSHPAATRRGLGSQDDRALAAGDRFAQVAFIMNSLEDLWEVRRKGAYLPWRVARLRYPKWLRGRIGELVFSPRADRVKAVVQLSAAVGLLSARSRRVRSAARIAQATTQLYQIVRSSGYGQDGSDQALVVQQAGQLVAMCSERGSSSHTAARYFVAGQAALSYFASGWVKLISPVWRSGDALVGVARSVNYGHPRAHSVMSRYPALRLVGAWGVIIGEVGAPVFLLMPRPVRRAWQFSMVLMHLAISATMGLNRFLWAFAGFHPVLDDVASEFGERLTRHRKTRRRAR